METGSMLAKIVYGVYIRTWNMEEFIKEMRKDSIYSNCEEDVLQTIYELIEFMYDITGE